MRGNTCNCNGNILLNSASAYPDYDSCKNKCVETETCQYFGVWDSVNHPDHCRLWDTCEICQTADNNNIVYRLSSGNALIFIYLNSSDNNEVNIKLISQLEFYGCYRRIYTKSDRGWMLY